jgi:peptidoglycan/xylan/chitin deacetylase (PgdA/CDA1 family)
VAASNPNGRTESLVALTFDDGPSGWTGPILDLLARHGGHATFFVLGNEIDGDDRRSALVRLVDEGHEVGNHTFSHPGDLASLDEAVILDELGRTTALVQELAGITPTLWRTPFLRVSPWLLQVASTLGLRHVDCSIMPGDWSLSGEETFARVRDHLEDGAVVVLHDGRPRDEPAHLSHPTREETVRAVELILEHMSDHDLRCVSVAELLAVDPHNAAVGPP